MCREPFDHRVDREPEYNINDSDSPFYIEAKSLLLNGYRAQLDIFIEWANGCHFNLADFVKDNNDFVDCMVYGVTEDDARSLATTILEKYEYEILSRLNSGAITLELDYKNNTPMFKVDHS